MPWRQRNARTSAAQTLGRGAAVRHRAVPLGVLEREPVALRVVRPAAKPVQERAEGGNFRVAAEERGIIELLQPALDGDDAPAPVVGQREHADQACDLVDVAGCGHVLDRGLRLAVLLVPGSCAAVQHLAEPQARDDRAQRGACHGRGGGSGTTRGGDRAERGRGWPARVPPACVLSRCGRAPRRKAKRTSGRESTSGSGTGARRASAATDAPTGGSRPRTGRRH